MEYNTRDIDLIELYLEGKLSGEDLLNFEREREENPELQRRVEEMAVIIDCVKSSGRESLLEELRELEAGLPEVDLEEGLSRKDNIISLGKTKIRKLYWRTSQYVALAASLAGIFFGLARPQIQFTRNEIAFRDYQTPLANMGIGSYRGEESGTIEYDAVIAFYEQGKYGRTIRALKNVENINEVQLMMLGNSFFLTKRYKKASECFKSENFGPESGLREEAKFSLALCTIALGDNVGAKMLLEELANGNNQHSADALRLLKSIKLKY